MNKTVEAQANPHRSGSQNGFEAGRPERTETLVIGAGQAGLSVGYQLARRGRPFMIVDANERVGDAWRSRWDSLRLFTPAKFDALPGMPFPAYGDAFPTKDEMADYLESYAERFGLPIRTGVRIDRLRKNGGRFLAEAGERSFEAENVVVAMSNFQRPKVPDFAGELDPSIVSLHSIDYRNPAQLQEGGVLLVGCGNSGAEIGKELAKNGHRVCISGESEGELPFRIDGIVGRKFLGRLVLRFVYHKVLTVDTPVGRKIRPKLLRGGTPLIRVKAKDLDAAGVERVPRTIGMRNGKPLLEDDRTLEVRNVIWCTGFHPGFSWIDLPVLNEDGTTRHDRGKAVDVEGLYFVGLHFLYSVSSAMVHGVGRDADRVAEAIEARALVGATAA